KYHDSIVDREANNGEHRRHEERVNLEVEEVAKDRPEAEYDEGVVQQSEDGASTEAHRELHAADFAEGNGDVDQNEERGGCDGQEGHEGLLARDSWTHRVRLDNIDRSKLLVELLNDLFEAWPLGGSLRGIDQVGLGVDLKNLAALTQIHTCD